MKASQNKLWNSPLLEFLAIAFLALLVTYPTLLDPQWELLDMGVMLREAKALSNDWTHRTFPGMDRYLPALVLYYSVLYTLFGYEVFYYYLAQIFLLILTAGLIWATVRLVTGNGKYGVFAAAIFLTSSTLAENYYTLGKQEPRLLFFWVASLFFYLRGVSARSAAADHSPFQKLGTTIYFAMSGLSVILSYFTKESVLLAIPALLICVLFSLFMNGRQTAAKEVHFPISGYLWLNLGVLMFFLFVTYGLAGTPLPFRGRYTAERLAGTFNWNQIVDYLQGSADVFFLTAILLAVIAYLLIRNSLPVTPELLYALFCTLCSAAYLGFFLLFWKQKLGYYLLPAAAWTALGMGLLCGYLTTTRHLSKLHKISLVVLISAVLFSRGFSIPLEHNMAVAQRSWNTVNGKMMTWVASLPKDTRVFLNYPMTHEYFAQFRLLLDYLFSRTDLTLSSATDVPNLARNLKVGGIILINFGEPANRQVRARLLNIPPLDWWRTAILGSFGGAQLDEVFRTEEQALIALPPTLSTHRFGLGWAGYRISSPPKWFLTKFGDGWIGKETELWVSSSDLPATLLLSGRSYLPPSISYPIHLALRSDSEHLDSWTVHGAGPFQFETRLDQSLGQPEASFVRLTITADQTFIPAQETGSLDTRELSVIIENVQLNAEGM